VTATAAPRLAERTWGGALSLALRLVLLLALVLIVLQSALVVHARPQDLVTGVKGMADMLAGKKVKVIWNQSGGGHSWPNWQVYLSKYTPLLFRD